MPTIPPQEHRTYHEWLHLEPDGALSRSEQSELERHLTSCADCRKERQQIAALAVLLAADQVEVHPELYQRVMNGLPPAGWEARHPRTWRWAAALFVLVAATAALVGWSSSGLAGVTPLAAVARAVVDLFATTAVAGAGLLTASWQGLGLALGEVLGGSRVTLGVFALFVAGLDFLFIRYLLRRPAKALTAARRSPE